MAKNIAAPIYIYLFFYGLLVSLCLIILGLAAVASYDIYHYFKNEEQVYAFKNCRKYFEQQAYAAYNQCYQDSVKYFAQHKNESAAQQP